MSRPTITAELVHGLQARRSHEDPSAFAANIWVVFHRDALNIARAYHYDASWHDRQGDPRTACWCRSVAHNLLDREFTPAPLGWAFAG